MSLIFDAFTDVEVVKKLTLQPPFFSLQSLFELELAGCNEITEAGLWACLTCRIVSLSLADCINVADEAVGAVAQLLPSLYEFSLQVRQWNFCVSILKKNKL